MNDTDIFLVEMLDDEDIMPVELLSEEVVFVDVNGSTDYENLKNKPSINGVTLTGNKTSGEIGIEEISNMELEDLLNGQI
jgi:hypothetical protein